MRFSHAFVAAALASCSLLSVSGVARADDTTTTTTRTTTDATRPGVVVGVPGVVGVEIGKGPASDDCTTRKTTHTNDETGDSVSRTTTNCN
jgi:hypothetical protein